MTILETSANVQEQILDAIKVVEDTALSAIEGLAQNVSPITEMLPAAPFADQLPSAVDVIDNAFGFAQKLLANQKDFAIKLVEAYTPAKSASKPAPKTPRKAA